MSDMEIIKYRPDNYIWRTQYDGYINLHDMTDLHIKNLIDYTADRGPSLTNGYNTILEVRHPVNPENSTTASEWIKILLSELKFRDVKPPDLTSYNLKYFAQQLKKFAKDNIVD